MENFIEFPNNLQSFDRIAVKETGVTMQMPVYLGLKLNGSDKWLLPIEPTISIRGRNVITRRTIAKVDSTKPIKPGSVKELWAKDDYEIIITGMLHNDEEEELPRELISRLTNLCTHTGPVYMSSGITDAVGIRYIAITDYDFPPTEGISYQRYSIKGFSDTPLEVLLK
ncbi:DUF6046 domain-containing protein [Salmonirosea aquatica]|uniref:DUF6046 domain-containing protein n=1 Tax=Salmonirosea aquatica TaxID=2654236 RepID=A0A7C9BG88_9BACT|nr:hypothetical protein [Cytophagaceae bacterium SJW1-29]